MQTQRPPALDNRSVYRNCQRAKRLELAFPVREFNTPLLVRLDQDFKERVQRRARRVSHSWWPIANEIFGAVWGGFHAEALGDAEEDVLSPDLVDVIAVELIPSGLKER